MSGTKDDVSGDSCEPAGTSSAGYGSGQLNAGDAVTPVGGVSPRVIGEPSQQGGGKPGGGRASVDGAREDTSREGGLVARCQTGDQQAMAELVERYQRYVYRLAYSLTGNRVDADDLAQDSMINILKGIENFKGRSSLTSWIYVVVLNTFRDSRRRAARRPSVSLDAQPGGAEQQPTPLWNEGDTLLRKELADVLHKVLAQVPEDFRMVVALYDIMGFSYEEIAQMLGLPIGTVKSRLHRGRHFMRDRLGSKTDLLG